MAGLLSLAVVGLSVGIQWFAFTPEAERTARLRKLGITRCREGQWHYRGLLVAWPPQRCLCTWPVQPDLDAQLRADQAERKTLETQ